MANLFHQKNVLAENVQIKDSFGTSYELSEILNSPIIDDTPELFGDIQDNSDLQDLPKNFKKRHFKQ